MPLTSTLRYFTYQEFKRPELVDNNAALALDMVRHEYGRPLVITDDARLPGERPPGAGKKSLHHIGKAFDLRTRSMTWGDLWDLTAAVMRVAARLRIEGRGGVEFELVWSSTDKHAHIAFAFDSRRDRLIVATE